MTGGGTAVPACLPFVNGRLLLVEDDDDIRLAIRMLLEDEGFEVVEAASGEEGLVRFQPDAIDLALVDLLLPGLAGLDVVRTLRATSPVPIIVVTAQADSREVVAGLEAGADDYVTKPFVPAELVARIKALLRRSQLHPTAAGPADDRQAIGSVVLRRAAGEVERNGEPIPLTKTEFRLLCELADHPGQVISREQLLERVWGYAYVGDGRLVDTHLYRLRAKIEDDAANPRVILTVRGLGYKLVLDPRS
jgi:DNA-binding response OmpR family regulator